MKLRRDVTIGFLTFCFFAIGFGDSRKINDCGEEQRPDDDVDYELAAKNLARPLRYQVYLNPCIESGNFSGYASIDLLVLSATKILALHAHNLEICEEGVYLSARQNASETNFLDLAPVTNGVRHVNGEAAVKKKRSSEENDDANSSTVATATEEASAEEEEEEEGKEEVASTEVAVSASSTTTTTTTTEQAIEGNIETPVEQQPNVVVNYDKRGQFVKFEFRDELEPGRYVLEINYLGKINDDAVGIYRKYYNDAAGQKRVLLLTNFAPISTRQIFPCRDEPSIKSEIHLSIQTPLDYKTITSITPNNYAKSKEEQRWAHLHPMLNTSTYQNIFAVIPSEMENLTVKVNDRTFVTFGASDDLKMMNLTNKIHAEVMKVMEGLTGMRYPLKTLVQLAIPQDNEVTSSSSLGFIATKKSYAVYNDRLGPNKKKDVMLRASRDVVSQWFNQLISPLSWRYTWLTEGLTDYVKYHILEKILPSHRFKEMFVVWELQRRSFIPSKATDGLPLNKDITMTPRNIQCIMLSCRSSFARAASVMRMISNFLTDKVFFNGIATFLKTNKLGSVEPTHFWDSLQVAIDQSKNEKLEKINISEVISSWTDSEFYPIINVTRDYTTGQIRITQVPAGVAFGLSETNSNHKWWIPITYTKQSDPTFNVTLPTHWLKPDMEELIIDGVEANDWVIFNLQHAGYYRVLYDTENWRRLASFLNSDDYQKIPPVNRAQIINDAVQLALNRHLNMDVFLDLMSYLKRETDYLPWYDAQFTLDFLNHHLSNTHAYDKLKQFGLEIVAPVADNVGYEDRPTDDFSTLLLRRITNQWACQYGHVSCWNSATTQMENYLNGKNLEKKASDLQEWAKCSGLKGADVALWNRALDNYKETPTESNLAYLACSENSTILKHFLDLAVANDSVIPKNHTLNLFKSVCFHRPGQVNRVGLCLDYICENFDEIKMALDENGNHDRIIYFLDQLVAEIREKSQLDMFKRLIAHEKLEFAADKLSARVQQTETRVEEFQGKADYYEPFLEAKLNKTA